MNVYIGGMFLAAALSAGGALPISPGSRTLGDDRGVLVRFSETCDSPELIEEPDKEAFRDGEAYILKECILEEVFVPEMRRTWEKKELYENVEDKSAIPGTIPATFSLRSGQEEISLSLSLAQIALREERWICDFQFPVTFHSYGADYYEMGAERITCSEGDPGLGGREKELLDLIGVDEEQYNIDSCRWAGEPYEDEEGVLCRDALARGRKKIGDYEVSYKGTADIPGFNRYRYREIYEKLSIGEEPQEPVPDSAGETASPIEKLIRIIRTCLKVTAGLGFILLLLFLFRLLRRLARRLDEERDRDK